MQRNRLPQGVANQEKMHRPAPWAREF